VAGKPSDWMFAQVPTERLELFREHLRTLIEAIRSSGAEPVLVTHAVSASMPLAARDVSRTEAMRVWMPRATAAVIGEFPYRANEVIRQVGAQDAVRVVDAAAILAGRQELFVDLVHFSEAGRQTMGRMLAAELGALP
jgi:lysophospholipase L1-like esterase